MQMCAYLRFQSLLQRIKPGAQNTLKDFQAEYEPGRITRSSYLEAASSAKHSRGTSKATSKATSKGTKERRVAIADAVETIRIPNRGYENKSYAKGYTLSQKKGFSAESSKAFTKLEMFQMLQNSIAEGDDDYPKELGLTRMRYYMSEHYPKKIEEVSFNLD